jgi:hypothetical protein
MLEVTNLEEARRTESLSSSLSLGMWDLRFREPLTLCHGFRVRKKELHGRHLIHKFTNCGLSSNGIEPDPIFIWGQRIIIGNLFCNEDCVVLNARPFGIIPSRSISTKAGHTTPASNLGLASVCHISDDAIGRRKVKETNSMTMRNSRSRFHFALEEASIRW